MHKTLSDSAHCHTKMQESAPVNKTCRAVPMLCKLASRSQITPQTHHTLACNNSFSMAICHGLANTEAAWCDHVGGLLPVLHGPLQTPCKVLSHMILICRSQLSGRA